tara:strand:- start:393 stop:578 length:186 start_codon:yes stop_codon:yes gene_type:complete
MITYIFIGVIWSLAFDWLLKTHSPSKEGIPSMKARLFHLILWPLAVFLVVRTQFEEDDDLD